MLHTSSTGTHTVLHSIVSCHIGAMLAKVSCGRVKHAHALHAGCGYIAYVLVHFKRWSDELRYLPRFFVAFAITVAELMIENFLVWCAVVCAAPSAACALLIAVRTAVSSWHALTITEMHILMHCMYEILRSYYKYVDAAPFALPSAAHVRAKCHVLQNQHTCSGSNTAESCRSVAASNKRKYDSTFVPLQDNIALLAKAASQRTGVVHFLVHWHWAHIAVFLFAWLCVPFSVLWDQVCSHGLPAIATNVQRCRQHGNTAASMWLSNLWVRPVVFVSLRERPANKLERVREHVAQGAAAFTRQQGHTHSHVPVPCCRFLTLALAWPPAHLSCTRWCASCALLHSWQ